MNLKNKLPKNIRRKNIGCIVCLGAVLVIGIAGIVYFTKGQEQTMYTGEVIQGPEQSSVAVQTPEEWMQLEEELVMEAQSGISLIMVGDMLMHTQVTESGLMEDGSYNYDHLFTHVKEDIQGADLALVNQEVILGGPELGYSGYPMFNTAYELGDSISDAGFDVVLHATNHTMDKGRKGLLNCLNYWSEKHPEIEVLGANKTEEEYEEIYIYEQNGIKLAILNYTYGLNGMPLPEDMPYAVDLLEEDKMMADLQKAEALADFTIVCVHWGTEYQTYASNEQKKWADFFLEQGVDLVLGTHPHVIQPVEWLSDEEGNQMLVYYSIGNFVNATSGSGAGVGKRAVGAMAEVCIARDDAGNVVINDYGVTPLVTQMQEGRGNITTYKLSEYNQELAEDNLMTVKDPEFSYDYCKELCKEVFGDLYIEE